jgi:hypothetical protein
MAENKKSFLLYADMIHTVVKMAKTEEGKKRVADLFITILEYVNDKNPVPEDPMVDIVFESIKQQLKRDLRSWEGTVEGKRVKSAMGNLKRWNKDLYDLVTGNKMSLQEALFVAEERKTAINGGNGTLKKTRTVKKTNGCDSGIAVNDNDNVNVNESEIILPPVEIKFNLIDTFLKDLPNSTNIERIAGDLKTTKAKLLAMIPTFRTKTELSYPNFDKFCYHFKSFARKELAEPSQPTNTKMTNYGG